MKDTPIDVTVETSANKVTLTVTVNENATGFVEVKFDGGVFNIALENGEGTFTTTLSYGSYNLDVTYLGDNNYNKNSTKREFTLVEPSKENTPISLDIVTKENNVTIIASVNNAATGLVKFQVTGSEEYTIYADVIDGEAVLEDILLTGDYTVFATYVGDSRFNSNITYEDFTILGHVKKDTPISANSDVNGNRVTLTVSVDENATGFVRLTVGGTVANIEVVDGVATLTTTLLANSYYVDVIYLGDDNYNMNNTAVTFTVVDVSKKTTPIGLNITVDESSVIFDVELNTMYMDVQDGHVETFTNSIEPGNYTVVATYMGDSVFNTNTITKSFEVIGHVMKDTPIDATVETSANKVTLTVTVNENATGFVELKFGDNLFNLALKDGIGTLTTSLPYGSYSLDITYLGDENYNKNSTKSEFTLVEPSKENTPISLDIVTEENYVAMTVNVNDAATGLVKFQVTGSEEYTLYADVINGEAVLEDILNAGNYTVIVTYMGDNRFNTNITYGDFKIAGHIKENTTINTNVEINGYDVKITVNVNESATGFVKIKLGNTIANLELTNGESSFIQTLTAGSYIAELTYLGDDNFNINSTRLTFTVVNPTIVNTPITLDVDIVDNNVTFTANVDPKAKGIVKFEVTGAENYTLYVDVADGVAILEDVLKAGDYTVYATYMGSSKFNSNVTSQVFIIFEKPDVNISVDVKESENDNVVVALPDDATGNITVFVDGKEVNTITVLGGNISVPITELTTGNHVVEIKYSGDSKYASVTNSVVVVKEHDPVISLTASDLTMLYTSGEYFKVRLTSDGQPFAGQNVIISIGGNIYSAVTDGNGYASIKITLAPNVYSAEATYGNLKITNKVTVNSIISAKNIHAKKSAKTVKVKVTLKKVNGKYLKNKKVTLKFNKKTFKVKTNSKGVATFKIKNSVFKKLKTNKKYTYQVIYGKNIVKKTIKFKK